MQINISEETANAIVKALEKQAADKNSTIGEIVAAREALAVMNEFIAEENNVRVYIKLTGIKALDGKTLYFSRVGEFTARKEFARTLTRTQAAKMLLYKEFYINAYGAADMIAERA